MTDKPIKQLEMPELLPCPFCGERADYYASKNNWRVRCRGFHCRAQVKGAWPDVAASIWNLRVPANAGGKP